MSARALVNASRMRSDLLRSASVARDTNFLSCPACGERLTVDSVYRDEHACTTLRAVCLLAAILIDALPSQFTVKADR
jgi:hypothetical protein